MYYNLVIVLTLLGLAEADFASRILPQSYFRDLVKTNYLKTILQRMDDNNKIEKLVKRSCSLNIPGMDCDLGYIKGAGKDHITWMNEIGPGKKRSLFDMRKRLCAFNLPGMECDFSEIRGMGKDHYTWINGEGPGKKRGYPALLQKRFLK